ncbi:conserved hypothetical protein [Shewanella halifaxensis HAW-EB4]|uniref:Tryptophan synthase beta chain-like PALP domain-containing protein n=1 Tax=Shewanella halifaxensis (strain HAW-EB4) TaxID=458817 RepID=B0TJG3_SHEHH|nr:pyridoxal-phosphate dependent enzyme [Shewanella halifaxensis]ABZ76959.1 conserved hypothetical protein [Shewanella halifaxensis HAW-EB4]
MLVNTPVETLSFNGKPIYVKRDDLLSEAFSGNKARKFAYFLDNDVTGKSVLVGHGSPVANSLYSMSALAKLKGLQLDFYVDHIADQVLASTVGNYAAAIANGANVIDLSKLSDRQDLSCIEYIEQKVLPNRDELLFVPEGGRCEYAKHGVYKLAQEVIDWCNSEQLSELRVFLPSGTGTTAVFLSEYMALYAPHIEVLTCACVGDNDYLKQQFSVLVTNEQLHPRIVDTGKKYHFGKLYRPFYEMYKKVSASGIEFELLYDPLGWMCVEKLLNTEAVQPILYIHQGGLLGNATMLPRYERKYGQLDLKAQV